jgi:hypothetical protein
MRKSKKQMDMLEQLYQENQQWTNTIIEEIAIKTGLKVKQVSKWLWDQKSKDKDPKISKKHKRVKTEEYESFEDQFQSEVSKLPVLSQKKAGKPRLNIKIDTDNLNDKNLNFKEKESLNTFSLTEPHSTNKITKVENTRQEPINALDYEKDSIQSGMDSKHSNKSFGFRDRFSKISKNISIKIKAPSIDELIKKPTIVPQENLNNFIGGNYSYQKDLRGSNPNFQNNSMAIPSPGFYRGPGMMRDNKDINIPMVFSRGHTPDTKQGTVFSFDSIKPPNMMPHFGSPPIKRPENDFIYNGQSPYRNDFFTKQPVFFPAYNFNNDYSSYRGRQGNQAFQYQMQNQDSVGKTPDGYPFFGNNGQQNPSSKMKNFFFNFENKPIGNNINSAFNTPGPMNERK